VIHVRRGWDRYEGEITPKSGRTRRVPIAAVLRDHLDEHLLRLEHTEGLVLGLDAVTPFSIPTTLHRARRAWGWRQKVQEGKRTRLWVPDERRDTLQPITLHECRHTYASLMIEAGVNAKALSTYMGHASIAITMDRYGHLMPGSEDQAAGLLDAYLDRADSRARVAQMAA
jgi:integrase